MTQQTTASQDKWSLPFFQSVLQYNATLAGYGLIRVHIALAYARKLSSVITATEFENILTDHVRDQFDILAEKIEELTILVERDGPENSKNPGLSFWD